jgi:deoxyribose-phosphate aldolase
MIDKLPLDTDNRTMTAAEIARRTDYTLLAPEALPSEIHKAAADAMQNSCAAACVAPVWIGRVATMLRGSGTRVCTVVGFPHGANKSTVKAIEATSSIKDGADEIDVVAHLPNLVRCNVDDTRAELLEIARAARTTRRDVVIKVIVESALLMRNVSADEAEARIAASCRAVRESGCDFIKTSTGFHSAGGASVQAVQLMKKHGEALQIKAAGGIRDISTAQAMIDAGAERLGMSKMIWL